MAPEWTIVHAGALGDLALTVQLALRLPRVALEGRLTLLSRANVGDLRAFQPAIHRVAAEGLSLHWLHMNEAGSESRCVAPPLLADVIRGRRVISALGGPDITISNRLAELAPAALFCFDPRPRGDWPTHIVDQWQRDLEAQGLLFDRCTYRGRGGRSLHAAAAPPEVVMPREVLIHPGSGGREKCWSRASFIAVAQRLMKRGDAVRFLAGPAERDWWGNEEFAALREAAPLVMCESADELAGRLHAARAFVGNDAGPAHLAALLGVATVAVFGPTRSERWRPLGTRATAVVAAQEDVARSADWGLSPEQIVAALDHVAPPPHDGRVSESQ